MTNILTDWREDLKTTLAAAFPDAEILDGERPSKKSRDKQRICVFAPAITAWDQDVNNAQPTMTIRMWLSMPRNNTEVPPDPGPIEQAMLDMAAALQPVLTSLDGPDFFQVTKIDPDYLDEYGIEVSLVGWTRSPMMEGG